MEKSNRAATCTGSAPWRTLLQKFIYFYFSLRRVCLDAQASSVHPDGHIRTGIWVVWAAVSQSANWPGQEDPHPLRLMWTGPEVWRQDQIRIHSGQLVLQYQAFIVWMKSADSGLTSAETDLWRLLRAGSIYHGNIIPPNTTAGNILVLTLQIFVRH